MKTAILVAGGAGYVGAHACKALSRAGYLPVVLDDFSTGHRDFVRWGPSVSGDIGDAGLVARTIRDFGCAGVLHFAARSLVGESVSDPARYYANNVGGTLGLLGGMREAGCDRLVFSSTCAVYGQTGAGPITEATPLAPINPYGASKLMAERILADFGAAYGLRSTVLRYFNASGADADAEIGEQRDPETHLIPRAMMALLGHLPDFAVLGADFATPDGTAIRDYVHVADLADAHVAALGALCAGGAGGIYNLGSGEGHSVRDVLHAIEQTTGRRLPAAIGARRPGDPAMLVADARLARRALGFVPRRSTLAEITGSAWAWHLRAHAPSGPAVHC
jgi:UDP-glucose 4-epimerase/UDP-arabinose 4-epimerase